jgi:post-segregation antitoxin (ccd killing protein)
MEERNVNGRGTSVELRVKLPERLARDARDAGLLSPPAIRALLRQAMRRRAAAHRFLGNAARVAAAGVSPLTEDEIQAEIDALRKSRRRPRRAARGR